MPIGRGHVPSRRHHRGSTMRDRGENDDVWMTTTRTHLIIIVPLDETSPMPHVGIVFDAREISDELHDFPFRGSVGVVLVIVFVSVRREEKVARQRQHT